MVGFSLGYSTELFVREFLLGHGMAYGQEIWRALKETRMARGLGVCTYDSFRRNYIYVLKKLGLIEPVKDQVIRDEWFPRRYYRIVPGKEPLTKEWKAPQKAFDPRRALGKKRYKKR